MKRANTLNNLKGKSDPFQMNPMTFCGKSFGHNVCGHVVHRDVLNGNETVLIGLSNDMILNINVFHSIVKARVFSKLDSSLIIHEERLWIDRFIGFGKFIK